LEYEPFIIGGLGTVATNLSKALARSGLQVTVLSRSPTSRFGITRKPRLSIIRFPKGPIYDRPAAAARWLMKRAFRKPDNIHIHSVQLANWAIFLRKKYKIPIFYTCHSLIAMEPGPLTKKRIIAESRQVQLLKIANKIVVPSRSELVHLKRRYPFSAKKTTVIKHGVAIRKSASRGPLHHLLYVGRLVPMKYPESKNAPLQARSNECGAIGKRPDSA
jgi:glycosyltransferase involved in cell wall biosynthesis